MTKKSALQKARAAYQPKLPSALWGAVKAVEGAEPTTWAYALSTMRKLLHSAFRAPRAFAIASVAGKVEVLLTS